jgi:hypothetical protein
MLSLVHSELSDCSRHKKALFAGISCTSRYELNFPQLGLNDWRRGRDSNPRYACAYFAFRVRRDRPLCHLSAIEVFCGRPQLNTQELTPCQPLFWEAVDRGLRPARNRRSLETRAYDEFRDPGDVYPADCSRNPGGWLPSHHFQKTGEKNTLASSPGLSLSGGGGRSL